MEGELVSKFVSVLRVCDLLYAGDELGKEGATLHAHVVWVDEGLEVGLRE